jgi:hypothetical protein
MTSTPIPEIGEERICSNGCPKCGSDLRLFWGVAEMCVNWQHPHDRNMHSQGGLRNCDYAIMGG